MKKVIWPGIVVGIASLVAGMILSYLFMMIPSVNADYNNPAIMRSFSDPIMMWFFLYPFIQGIIWALAWDYVKPLFKGKDTCGKVRPFGFMIFLVSTIPGMFVTFVSMPYSFWTVISWTVGGFVDAMIAGHILVRMNK